MKPGLETSMSESSHQDSGSALPAPGARTYLESFVRVMSGPAVVLDADLRLVTATDSFYKTFGIAHAEAQGRSIFDLNDSEWNTSAIRQLLCDLLPKTTSVSNFQIRHLFKNSGLRLLILNACCFMENSSAPPLIVLSIEDITDRSSAQESLRESEQQFRTMANAMPQLAWIARPDGHIFWYNDRWYGYTGTSAEEMEGWGWQSVHDPATLPQVLEKWRKAIGCQETFEMTFPLRASDGTFRPFLTRSVPLKNSSGQVIQWFGTNTDISDLKRVEEALNASEARFRTAVGIVSSLIWTNNAEGMMEGEQPGWGAFTGQTQKEYQGYGWSSALHPQDALPTVTAWRQAVNGKHLFEFEHRVRRHDGEWRLCSVRAAPVIGSDGLLREWVGVHTDITENRKAEMALREREALFAKLIEQAPGGMYVIDSKFRVINVNPQARPTFAAAEPLIGRDFGDVMQTLWGPEQGPVLSNIFRHTLNSGERYRSPTFTNLRYDLAVEKTYEWETQRITLPSGDFGVVCYFKDITEERALEMALRKSEQRAKRIIESISDGFITMDREWRITYMSPRAGVMVAPLQKTMDSVLGKIFWDEFPAIVGTDTEVQYRRAMTEQVSVHFEMFYQPLNQWFDIRAYPSHFGLSLYFLDTTDRKLAEAALRANEVVLAEQATALRTVAQRKDEFLAELAHELRNPLAPIRTGLRLMQLAGTDESAFHRASGIVDRQLTKVVRLVDDLMDVSRISSGKIEIHKKRVALSDVVNDAVETSRPLIDAAGHEITIILPPEPVFIFVDPVRLGQIISNLLNNAAKYSDRNRKILLTIERAGEDFTIRVKDNGIGIEPDMLENIFVMFTQIKSGQNPYGGLGIGLALVKRLVEMHGGSIKAFSAGKDRGSEFVLTMPALLSREVGPTHSSHPDVSKSTIKRRVLVADDNVDASESLALLLEIENYEVRVAKDGAEAVELATGFRPEIILLDLGMPKLDGYEVCRFIRNQPWGQEPIIFALTGWGHDKDKQRTKEAGFNNHLVKPVDLDILTKLLSIS